MKMHYIHLKYKYKTFSNQIKMIFKFLHEKSWQSYTIATEYDMLGEGLTRIYLCQAFSKRGLNRKQKCKMDYKFDTQ